MPKEITIFKKGSPVASNGEKHSFGDKELDEIVESYDPQHFRAPLIISHNTFGVPDHKLVDYSADDGSLPTSKHLAFGFPDKLKRVGDAIVGVFSKISPKFEKLNREGAILSISSSLYKPSSPNNPYPGKWALRHIAGLGAEPPAVKGMTPLSLSELAHASNPGDEFAIAFSEEEGVLEFGSLDFGTWAWSQVGQAFQGLREWIIEQYDMETADRVLPSSLVGILQQESTMPDPGQWEIQNLRERVARLEGSNNLEAYSMSDNQNQNTDFAERENKLTQREQAIAKREAELRRSEFVSFCETDLKERLTPAMAPRDEVVAFMEFLATSTEGELSFSDSKKLAPLVWFKSFLSNLPAQVSTRRLPGDNPKRPALNYSDRDGDYDAESQEMDARINAYIADQRKQGRELSYSEATDELLAANVF